jgi:hypothetical protein
MLIEILIVTFCALIGANEGTRVVNGTDATVEEFPFIVKNKSFLN